MHDIWNPWHGCVKCSEGCENCYMYYLDAARGKNGAEIYRTKTGFTYPMQRDRSGARKVKSGEMLRVCMVSDFFLREADAWREEAWEIIRSRPDVKFYLLTKRPERVRECLPEDFPEAFSHVMLNVTAENARRAEERVPILLSLPFAHKGVMCAPLIGEVSLAPYLASGEIEQVVCGGENYGGARPCRFEWVEKLRDECREYGVTFVFTETGSVFYKDGRRYDLPDKRLQSRMAYRSGVSFAGREFPWKLTDSFGLEIPPERLHVPRFSSRCRECGMRLICNGCSDCGACGKEKRTEDPSA